MTSINEIFEEILKKIVPTNQELDLINQIVEKLKYLLNNKAQALNIKFLSIEPQGSTGIKQTQLKDDFDIDLFIGLDYNQYKGNYKDLTKNQFKKESKNDFLKLCNDWIIKSLESKEFLNPRILYAEHPYVSVDYFTSNIKLKIDIVLHFDLDLDFIKKNGPKTAVDRSPWHGRFIRDSLTSDQKNEVRLLKQFFKACHSYGDKSAVGKVGFIGYSAELLIYHFKNLENCFKNFNTLKDIALDYYGRSKTEIQKIIHFQNDFLIIIDPIDKNRNVASAISDKAYNYVNLRIKAFLDNPSKDFFEIHDIPEIKPDGLDKFFIIECKNKDQNVHYTICRDKLYALGDNITNNGEKEYSHANRFGKIVFEVYFEDKINQYNLAIYCDKPIISETYLRRGPLIAEKKHAEKFKKSNPNFVQKDKYLWVETKREHSKFLDFLNFVEQKISDKLEVVNVSNAKNAKNASGKKAIYVLKNMVLPFYLKI